MALSTVELTWDLSDFIQSGQQGTMTLIPTEVLTDATDNVVIGEVARSQNFAGGTGSLPGIVACDNTQISPGPGNWAYTITAKLSTGQVLVSVTAFINHASGSVQDLSDLVPVAAPSALAASSVPGLTVFPSGDTSGATDQTAITAAEATGKKIYFAPGTYWVTGLLKQSLTYWEGAGIGATVIKLADGANTDVVQGAGFASLSLTGVSGWGTSGIYDWGISGMTLDGNASNQSGTSYGLRFYGYQWTLQDLAVRNCLNSGIWSEWGPVSSDAPVTTEGGESTARNVRVSWNGEHGWMHLGSSDIRISNAIIFKNNQNLNAAGIGLWALQDQVSNICLTAVSMNGTNASGFTGTFNVQAAAAFNATNLYASSGTLKVTTSSGTATMTYTGKTATAFTGCTVTSGSGTFQTGNKVITSGNPKFTTNGLQLVACHVWGYHTWDTVLDSQVSEVDCHWEGAYYGQLLVRGSVNRSGGFLYDFTGIAPGCALQLGDNGSTPGIPQSAAVTANSCDIRTAARAFLLDTPARSAVNWVSATQSSVDMEVITKTTGTYTTTVAAGSNGADVSAFTGGSPGVINVASTNQIPNGAGTLTVATATGPVTCTFTGTNGSSGTGPGRTAGTQFTGVVATGSPPGGSTMSTGGAVALANIGTVGVGGTVDSSSRVHVNVQSATTAASTAASYNHEFGPHIWDIGAAAAGLQIFSNGTQLFNLNASNKQLQLPNGVELEMWSDNFGTKTVDIPSSTGIAALTAFKANGLTGATAASRYAGATASGAPGSGTFTVGDFVVDQSGKIWICTAAGSPGTWVSLVPVVARGASVSYTPSNPTATASGSLVAMGLGATCTFTPAGTGIVAATVSGFWNTATASVNGVLSARYGTGTAPVNGAASSGTRWGTGNSDPSINAARTQSGAVPFSFTQVITGLTLSTAYWFDLVTSTSNPSDSATITNVVMTLQELPA